MHPGRSWTARRLLLLLLPLLAGPAGAVAAKATKSLSTRTAAATPCVATHSTSGAMYDLRPDVASVPERTKHHKKGAPTEDYVWSRPAEWPYNFTMNICAPVLHGVDDVVGVDKALWPNISAYYEQHGEVYSLGLLNTTLVPRGTQLILRYTGGSPCGQRKKSRKRAVHEGAAYKHYAFEDDEDYELPSIPDLSTYTAEEAPGSGGGESHAGEEEEELQGADSKGVETAAVTRRKSAIISFRCDRDPASPGARFSFLEADEDECTYVFSVLSQHACAKTDSHKPGSVGPGSVFAIILLVAVLVYLVGGVMYQRTVTNARGWRQLPNYSLWAGIWSSIQDLFIILFASCARLLRGRRGYRSLSRSPTGRGRHRDDENRLIDQLDEEWDD